MSGGCMARVAGLVNAVMTGKEDTLCPTESWPESLQPSSASLVVPLPGGTVLASYSNLAQGRCDLLTLLVPGFTHTARTLGGAPAAFFDIDMRDVGGVPGLWTADQVLASTGGAGFMACIPVPGEPKALEGPTDPSGVWKGSSTCPQAVLALCWPSQLSPEDVTRLRMPATCLGNAVASMLPACYPGLLADWSALGLLTLPLHVHPPQSLTTSPPDHRPDDYPPAGPVAVSSPGAPTPLLLAGPSATLPGLRGSAPAAGPPRPRGLLPGPLPGEAGPLPGLSQSQPGRLCRSRWGPPTVGPALKGVPDIDEAVGELDQASLRMTPSVTAGRPRTSLLGFRFADPGVERAFKAVWARQLATGDLASIIGVALTSLLGATLDYPHATSAPGWGLDTKLLARVMCGVLLAHAAAMLCVITWRNRWYCRHRSWLILARTLLVLPVGRFIWGFPADLKQNGGGGVHVSSDYIYMFLLPVMQMAEGLQAPVPLVYNVPSRLCLLLVNWMGLACSSQPSADMDGALLPSPAHVSLAPLAHGVLGFAVPVVFSAWAESAQRRAYGHMRAAHPSPR